jgi:major vault protein
VYLRVKNNQISDIISAETRDHVNVKFKVSLRGDFTGEPNRWFDVENYVKLICDHVRSMVRGVVHQLSIQDLYSDPTNILRDAILGAKKEKTGLRPGLLFEENGFQLNDVEVLEFSVGDNNIAQMLNNTQHTVVGSSIELLLAEKKLEIDKRQEQLKQERITAKHETQRLEALQGAELETFLSELAAAKTIRDLDLAKERANARLEELKKQLEVDAEAQRLQEFNLKSELERKQLAFNLDKTVSEHTQELSERKLHAETDAVLARFQAAQSGFSEALLTMSNQETLVRIAEAMGIQNYIGGPNAVEAIKRVFDGTPVQETVNNLLQKAAGKHEKK